MVIYAWRNTALKRKIVLAGNIAPIFFGLAHNTVDPLSTAVSQ